MTPTTPPVDLAALRKLAEAAVPVFVPGPGATPPAVVLALIRELEAARNLKAAVDSHPGQEFDDWMNEVGKARLAYDAATAKGT